MLIRMITIMATVMTTEASLFPGEGRGPVMTGPQLDPGLRRGTGVTEGVGP